MLFTTQRFLGVLLLAGLAGLSAFAQQPAAQKEPEFVDHREFKSKITAIITTLIKKSLK